MSVYSPHFIFTLDLNSNYTDTLYGGSFYDVLAKVDKDEKYNLIYACMRGDVHIHALHSICVSENIKNLEFLECELAVNRSVRASFKAITKVVEVIAETIDSQNLERLTPVLKWCYHSDEDVDWVDLKAAWETPGKLNPIEAKSHAGQDTLSAVFDYIHALRHTLSICVEEEHCLVNFIHPL